MSKTIEQAKTDLAGVVAHLREAAAEATHKAKGGSRVQFAIIARNPDGTGVVGASFDCEAFLSDLEVVFPPTQEDLLEARASCLLSKVGENPGTMGDA